MEKSLKKEQTILLTTHSYNWKPTVLQIFTFIIGLLLILYSFSAFLNNEFNLYRHSVYIIHGSVFLFFGFFVYNRKSPLAPKFVINEHYIASKTGVFKKRNQFHWDRIKEIEFGPYQINIKLEGSNSTIHYEASADISLAIKDAIRDMANSKGLKILAG